jgi:hypothetical protein
LRKRKISAPRGIDTATVHGPYKGAEALFSWSATLINSHLPLKSYSRVVFIVVKSGPEDLCAPTSFMEVGSCDGISSAMVVNVVPHEEHPLRGPPLRPPSS